MADKNEKHSSHSIGNAFALRTLLLLVLWHLLTGADFLSWWLGLAICVIAASVSVKILPPLRVLRWHIIPRFLIFFFKYAFIGSVDVARRALHPALPINPAEIKYLTCLPEGAVQTAFIAVLGLLPGTLCMNKKGATLVIHVIDCEADLRKELRRLEVLIAALFSVECGNE